MPVPNVNLQCELWKESEGNRLIFIVPHSHGVTQDFNLT